MSRLQLLLAAMMILGILPFAHAEYIPVYFPVYDYDPATGTGLSNYYNYAGLAVNNSGTVVGEAEKFEGGDYKGHQAIRWDASGAPVTGLGGLGPGSIPNSAAWWINNSGTAIGYASAHDSNGTYIGTRAVTWSASGTEAVALEDIGRSFNGFTNVDGYCINDSGVAMGQASKYVDGICAGDIAVRWDASGAATALEDLGSSASGEATAQPAAMSNAGAIVGYSVKYVNGISMGKRPTRWDALGTAITELDNLGVNANGRANGQAVDTNSAGTAVGSCTKFVDTADKGSRAVRWDVNSSTVMELGGLGTNASGFSYAKAKGINDEGVIIGVARKYVDEVSLGERAVRWGPSGAAATELGMLGTDTSGYGSSVVKDISEDGLLVGNCAKYTNGAFVGYHAVCWDMGGQITDFNDLIDPNSGWLLTDARMISDNGEWVVGDGTFDPDGVGPQAAYQRVFLMRTPEPASMSLLAVGGLVMLRRRMWV